MEIIEGSGAEQLRVYIRDFKAEGHSWDELGSTLRSWAESGIPKNPQDKTFARFDRLREWKPGSAKRVYNGGEPEPLTPNASAAATAARLMRTIRDLAEDAAQVLERGER